VADAAVAAKKKGKLPVWAWAILGVVLLYFAYRFLSSGSLSALSSPSASTTSSTAPTDTTTSSDGSTGLTPSAGSPTDSGQLSSDLVSALGGQQASLLSALETQNQDVLGLAQSQIAAAQANGTSPSTTSETQPVNGQQPGGSNAPVVTYVSPQALAPTSSKPPPAQKATVKAPAATRYYTYKRDVPLASGQTVHFLTGRGYYAG
jgi:hypothetical protein